MTFKEKTAKPTTTNATTRKITILAGVLGASLLLSPTLLADHRSPRWGFSFGFGGGYTPRISGHFGHRPRVRCEPPAHVHHEIPVYNQIWIPARHESVIVGYDHCGRPLYRAVCVSPGHYETVIVGYRCGCGHRS